MTRTNASKTSHIFGDFSIPSFEVEAIGEAQQKNVEAFIQANQLAVDGARALAQRQAEIEQQAIEEVSGLLRGWTQPSAPEDRLAKHVEAAKQAFEKGLAHAHVRDMSGWRVNPEVLVRG
jgi:hypothetical protein